MFVFDPHADLRPEGMELVGALPPFAVRRETFKDRAWSAGYYCLKCLPDIWDTRPTCTAELLQRYGPAVFPQAGDRHAPARARIVRAGPAAFLAESAAVDVDLHRNWSQARDLASRPQLPLALPALPPVADQLGSPPGPAAGEQPGRWRRNRASP